MQHGSGGRAASLQDKPAQILIARELAELRIHIGHIDHDTVCVAGGTAVRGAERGFFQKPLHDRMQATRADVLGALVHFARNFRDTPDTFTRELYLQPLGGEQCPVLLGERGIRFGENALEFIGTECIELDAYRQPSLQFGDQVCLLYTSDAADERSSVDLGGRRIIKKKNMSEVRCRRLHDQQTFTREPTSHRQYYYTKRRKG